eukprot:TRINITY_DN18402_c0_g1_i1.p1 TRINITY_DN18402_c0_g1~~TRINITY_DN18402_c0_g1_i1.p1  ORF type:complete len:324 (-),score=24.97 TRINITY_DN18402_c0_g1_i1:12-983(-)
MFAVPLLALLFSVTNAVKDIVVTSGASSRTEVFEHDLISRQKPERLKLKKSAVEHRLVDIFFAFDTRKENRQKRAVSRHFLNLLKDEVSSQKAHSIIEYRFFADDVESVQEDTGHLVLQPPPNRVEHTGMDYAERWSSRWLFDVNWALTHLEFKRMIRADDDGYLCPATFLTLWARLPNDVPHFVYSSEAGPVIDLRKGSSELQSSPAMPTSYALEENFMLFDRSFALSLIQQTARFRPPKDTEILPEYLEALSKSGWPDAKTKLFNMGRAGRSWWGAYSHQGYSVWDGEKISLNDLSYACKEQLLLWIHRVGIIFGSNMGGR